ncbi:MAG: hypothetical protein JNJ73_04735 [Hyphomonadaceae bacterium]|nr:hypothetical protein [Hyphomonadaceae bacterium]
MRYVVLWVRVAFGVHSLVSGLNHFLEFPFLPLPPLDASPAGVFIAELARIGLYDVIKAVEVAVGLCLVSNRFVPLALVMEFPITLSIFWLNTFVDAAPRQLFTGPRELFYNVFLLAAYAGYYAPMLGFRVGSSPIWRPSVAADIAGGVAGKARGPS